MNDYDDTNRGACWPNAKKLTGKHPDYRGDLDVEGVEYWVSMWINPHVEGKQPPIKFSISRKEPAEDATPVAVEDLEALKARASSPDEAKPFDDDIPF